MIKIASENVPPIADPDGPYLGPVGSPIYFDGTESFDPDGDSLIYEWHWGDNTISTTTDTIISHTYTDPGIYEVCLAVNDGYETSDCICTYAVVYDPSAGFITGGGWIYSQAGAYTVDPTLEGRANFGFVSRYKTGKSVPDGQTEFQFKAGDLNFHSVSYDWLVVTGSNYARFKGIGTISGEGECKFMIWAGDDESDTFRIKIWEEDDFGNEAIIYDNGFDQVIGGGNIVVHVN